METFTIKEAAERLNVPASTLRYYDKEGLLPFVERSKTGYRLFTEGDLRLLRLIECLKKTGMQLRDIRRFVEWMSMGDESLNERYELFFERRSAVEAQIAELQEMLALIEYKCAYYERAVAAGTEKVNFTEGE